MSELDYDVHIGDVEEVEVNWWEVEDPDPDDEEMDVTPEDVVGMLGFDPLELEEDTDEEGNANSGEPEGHPFRGNQYTAGGGTGDNEKDYTVIDDKMPLGLDIGPFINKQLELLNLPDPFTITPEETVSVSEYTIFDSVTINKYLRDPTFLSGQSGPSVDYRLKLATTAIPNIDSAIEKFSLKENLTLFRGIGDRTWAKLFKIKLGDIFTDAGYVSASSSLTFAKGFNNHQIKILVPKGTNILPVDTFLGGKQGFKFNPHVGNVTEGNYLREGEFILPRGLSFKVVNLGSDGRLVLKVVGKKKNESLRELLSPKYWFLIGKSKHHGIRKIWMEGNEKSGNYDHAGRPGQVGGSAPRDGGGGDSPKDATKGTGEKTFDYENRLKVAKVMYAAGAAVEPAISANMLFSAASSGTTLSSFITRPDGTIFNRFDTRLKTEASIARKLQKMKEEEPDRVLTLDDAAKEIKDVVRYTTIAPEETFYDACENMGKTMVSQGYELVKKSNYFERLGSYGGINTKFRDTTTGYVFEVQFHTKESVVIAEKNHPIYERQRLSKDAAEIAALEKEMIDNWKDFKIPARAGEVFKNWGKA